MALTNSILQQYVNDPSSPKAGVDYIKSTAAAGQISEDDLAAAIQAKYPNKYGSNLPATPVANSNQVTPRVIGGKDAYGNFAIDETAKNLINAAGSVADYTVKPLAKAAVMSVSSLPGTISSGAQQLGNTFQHGINFDKNAPDLPGTSTNAPIEIPGLGNVNPQTSAANTVGTAGDLLSTLIPNEGVLKAGARGLLQGLSKGAQDKNATLESTITRGGVEGVVNAILTPLLHVGLGGITNEGVLQKGLKMNVPEQALHQLDKLDPAQKKSAVELIKVGIDKLHNMINGTTPFEHAGQPINDFIEQANTVKNQLGEAVGATKESLTKVKASTEPVKSVLTKVLDKLNITVGPKNVLNFENSDIANVSGAQEMLQKIYKTIAPYKQMNARDLEAITGQIDSTTGLLNNSGYSSKPFNTHLSNIKNAINTTVGESSPAFKEANQKFAKFIGNFNKVAEAAGTENVGQGQIESNGAKLLRKSLTKDDKVHNAALDAMGKIGKEFGIEVPSDLHTKAFLAKLAEDYTTSNRGASVGGVSSLKDLTKGTAKRFVEGVPGGKAAVALGEGIHNATTTMKAPLEEQANNLIKLIQGTPADKLKVLPPKLRQGLIDLISPIGRAGASSSVQGLISPNAKE